jgi:uncharacterized cupin superfamily protein
MEPVNDTDLDWTESNGQADFRRKQLADAAPGGGQDLGCSLYELDPGASAWPYHYHAGNAEAMYVLDGTGMVRCPDGEYTVTAGDYLAFPASPDGAHQVVNDSEASLHYLVFSTMRDPDVTRYVDADALGVYEGSPPGSHADREFTGYFAVSDGIDYWADIDGRGRTAKDRE